MKKIIKSLSIIVLIISILLILTIVIFNLITIIKIMFFGLSVGSNEHLDSIWFGQRTLYGISGIKTYYSVWSDLVMIVEIPTSIVCIIYQIIYFRKIRKSK